MDLPDLTFFLQGAIFLLLWVVLSLALFGPLSRFVEQRTRRIKGCEGEAQELGRQTAEQLERYQQRLAAVRSELNDLFVQTQRDLEAEGQRLALEAQGRAATLVAEAKSEIGQAVATARRQLEGEVRSLSVAVAGRVLGRPLQAPGGRG